VIKSVMINSVTSGKNPYSTMLNLSTVPTTMP
jgi:hypothetical protein